MQLKSLKDVGEWYFFYSGPDEGNSPEQLKQFFYRNTGFGLPGFKKRSPENAFSTRQFLTDIPSTCSNLPKKVKAGDDGDGGWIQESLRERHTIAFLRKLSS